MALFDGATWVGPSPNIYPDGMESVMGLVLHIMQSGDNVNVDGYEVCISWFKDSASQVSAHFINGTKEGELGQMVDTKDAAWAEVAGNPNWVSVENSGNSGESLLPTQLTNLAKLIAWMHTEHGMPLQKTDSPSTPGLGWHGMGGEAWGGHLLCPGQPVLDQRDQLLQMAKELLQPIVVPEFPGRNFRYTMGLPLMFGDDIKEWQTQMIKRGWDKLAKGVGKTFTADGYYGPISRWVCISFQKGHTIPQSGVVGLITWRQSWLAAVPDKN